MDKNVFKIRIAGKDYVVSGTESEEYMNSLAHYVETKFLEVTKTGGAVNSFNTMVLTSINIADDYLQLKQTAPDVRGRISELEDTVIKLEKELKDSKEIIRILEEQNANKGGNR